MAEPDQAARREWMGLMARAGTEGARRLEAAVGSDAGGGPSGALGRATGHSVLRPPEIGSVMVRGRAGATGAPFNFGEMTVTRCSLQLATGQVGHGYVQGRDKAAAEAAAMVDALMQTDAAPQIRAEVLDPLRAAEATRRAARAEKAATTKVEFFTMTRGDTG